LIEIIGKDPVYFISVLSGILGTLLIVLGSSYLSLLGDHGKLGFC
jgi:hypothetical protein